MASFLRLHPTDNVVVAVNGLSPGDIVDDVKIIRRIPPGHKAAASARAASVITPISSACSADAISRAMARSGGRCFTWNSRSMPSGA